MEHKNASPLDALRKFGITATEGEAFHVVGAHTLGEVRERFAAWTTDLPEGHGWRLFALLDDGDDFKEVWRCTVGRADAWPFPATVDSMIFADWSPEQRAVPEKATDTFLGLEVLERAERLAHVTSSDVPVFLRGLAARSDDKLTPAERHRAHLAWGQSKRREIQASERDRRTKRMRVGLLLLGAAALVAAAV